MASMNMMETIRKHAQGFMHLRCTRDERASSRRRLLPALIKRREAGSP
jgi:hypothetical protein